MKVNDPRSPDVKIIEPNAFEDDRGFFFKSFNQKKFEEAIGYSLTFVQDNQSKSPKGILGGVHHQVSLKHRVN